MKYLNWVEKIAKKTGPGVRMKIDTSSLFD